MRKKVIIFAAILVNFQIFSTNYAFSQEDEISQQVFENIKQHCNKFAFAMHNPKTVAGAAMESYELDKIPANPEPWLKKRLELYLKARPDLPDYQFYYGNAFWQVISRDTKIKIKALTSLKIRELINLKRVPKNCDLLQLLNLDFESANKTHFIARHETPEHSILYFAHYNKRSKRTVIEDIYVDKSVKELLQEKVANEPNKLALRELWLKLAITPQRKAVK